MWYSKPPLGRAEQRSSVRMKALALSERSEFASAPNAASSARHRVSGTDVARLFFGYFFLALLKKSNSAAGPKPGLQPEHNTVSTTNTLSPRPRATTRVAPTPSLLIPHRARHAVPLRPNSSLLTPTTSLLTPHSSVNQSSIPRCAGIPAANACLTIFISVTVSASATISSGQRRPVSTTCTCAGRFCKVTSTSSSGSQP